MKKNKNKKKEKERTINKIKGNKGAIAIRFQLFDSYFCFVNSHLAAGHDELERRNEDFKDICCKLFLIKRTQESDDRVTLTFHSIFECE